MSKRENDELRVPDREIIRRCLEGESNAEEMLYKRYFSFAMSVCLRYTKDEGEAMETVNDSYMKVLDKLQEYDESRPFRAWYGKILVNSAIDNYRKRARFSSPLSADIADGYEEMEAEIEAELSAEEIIALFRELPEQYRVTFNLYEIEGYSHDEIAEKLGITASTSRANLARAKKMLRELYVKKHAINKPANEAI